MHPRWRYWEASCPAKVCRPDSKLQRICGHGCVHSDSRSSAPADLGGCWKACTSQEKRWPLHYLSWRAPPVWVHRPCTPPGEQALQKEQPAKGLWQRRKPACLSGRIRACSERYRKPQQGLHTLLKQLASAVVWLQATAFSSISVEDICVSKLCKPRIRLRWHAGNNQPRLPSAGTVSQRGAQAPAAKPAPLLGKAASLHSHCLRP